MLFSVFCGVFCCFPWFFWFCLFVVRIICLKSSVVLNSSLSTGVHCWILTGYSTASRACAAVSEDAVSLCWVGRVQPCALAHCSCPGRPVAVTLLLLPEPWGATEEQWCLPSSTVGAVTVPCTAASGSVYVKYSASKKPTQRRWAACVLVIY